MTGQDIADRFADQMNDPNHVRFPLTEVLRWINSGQMLIALLRPDSSATNEVVTLVAGTKQSLPAGGMRLFDVTRSIHPTTGASLRSVSYVDKAVLDRNPGWHALPGVDEISHFTYDERNPKVFYVYPPAKNGSKVEVIYSRPPAPLTSLSDPLSVDAVYSEPILEYTLFRAYSFDRQFALQPHLAAAKLSSLSMMMGVKIERDRALSPEQNNIGAMPGPGNTTHGGAIPPRV